VIYPLIRFIRSNYQECGYQYDKDKRKVIQAYAVNLLLFADIKEHLNTISDG
jgi:hypothetical protein